MRLLPKLNIKSVLIIMLASGVFIAFLIVLWLNYQLEALKSKTLALQTNAYKVYEIYNKTQSDYKNLQILTKLALYPKQFKIIDEFKLLNKNINDLGKQLRSFTRTNPYFEIEVINKYQLAQNNLTNSYNTLIDLVSRNDIQGARAQFKSPALQDKISDYTQLLSNVGGYYHNLYRHIYSTDILTLGNNFNFAIVVMSLLMLACVTWVYFLFVALQKDKMEKYRIILSTDEKYKKLACYDPLTQLPNRVLFQELLKKAIASAQQIEKRVGVLYIDLDKFKRVNDTLGHEAGDLLLQLAARRLQDTVRQEDSVARLGGDEFAIILSTVVTIKEISIICRRIIYAFKLPFILYGHEISISPSIGVSVFPDGANDIKTLVKNADLAMYKAKNQGRNCYHFYTESLNQEAHRLLIIEEHMREALKENNFKILYQPQYCIETNKIIGIEALVRFKSENLQSISPAEFIPIAEDTGLIHELGKWITGEVCKTYGAWYKANPHIFKNIPVSLNVSIAQLEKTDFVDVIIHSLSDNLVPATNLILEVTETAIFKHFEAAKKVLVSLHNQGIDIALDDFGTGYSSISLLQLLPIRQIKIDSSFVKDIPYNNDSSQLVIGVINLAKQLKLEIVAEGVEKKEQIDFLLEHGCKDVQGYYYSKPLTDEQLLAKLFSK